MVNNPPQQDWFERATFRLVLGVLVVFLLTLSPILLPFIAIGWAAEAAWHLGRKLTQQRSRRT